MAADYENGDGGGDGDGNGILHEGVVPEEAEARLADVGSRSLSAAADGGSKPVDQVLYSD
ncbi:hypothetical protein LTR16_009188, partial [Cryomyces antarcticus]